MFDYITNKVISKSYNKSLAVPVMDAPNGFTNCITGVVVGAYNLPEGWPRIVVLGIGSWHVLKYWERSDE
jgi:hypothetical protein